MSCGQTLSQLKTKLKNLVNRTELSIAVIKGEFKCRAACVFCPYFDLCWYDYTHLVEEIIGEPIDINK